MISSLRDPSLLKSRSYASGTWCEATSGEIIDVTDPADGSSIGSVPALSATEVESAIAFATDAMTSWKQEPAGKRAALLRRWHELVTGATDDLAALITAELGKPLAESHGEVRYAASYISWYAEEATRIDGEIIPGPSADKRVLVLREPVGLCAAITPWNFPAAMVTRKVAPALAAGCAIMVKPASQTPLTCLALAELALRAGIPAGLFSVLTGKSSVIGPVLTGSATMKRVTMELGGNAPFIVFDDADLEAAVEGLMASKFRGSGQTCVCANRILIHSSIAERFTALLATAVGTLRVGPGTTEGITQGPLIDEAAVEKVEKLITDAVFHGATIEAGGRRHDLGGTFFEPTILAGCTASMKIAREEIFGPVVPIFIFETEEEAVSLANATPFGLAGYFYSRDLARVWRVAEALECGMVGVNTGIISNAAAPFGGIKQSGFGREGSRHGISDYLSLKYVCMGGLE